MIITYSPSKGFFPLDSSGCIGQHRRHGVRQQRETQRAKTITPGAFVRRVDRVNNPSDVHGIRSGLIHSKNWGELTHLRAVGSSPPSSIMLIIYGRALLHKFPWILINEHWVSTKTYWVCVCHQTRGLKHKPSTTIQYFPATSPWRMVRVSRYVPPNSPKSVGYYTSYQGLNRPPASSGAEMCWVSGSFMTVKLLSRTPFT